MYTSFTTKHTTFLTLIALLFIATPLFSNCDDQIFAGTIGDSQTVCSDDNLSIDLQEVTAATGGNGIYEYQWIFTFTNPNTSTAIWVPMPGATNKDYTLYVDQNVWLRRCVREAGCTLYMSETNIIAIVVEDCTQDCAIVTSMESTDVTCANATDGYLKVNAFNGLAPYTYAWSNGSTTQTQYDLSAGNYSVTVTDLTGCEAITEYTLTQPETIDMTFEVVQPLCYLEQGAIALDVTGGTKPYTFQWNGAFINSPSIFGLDAGDYTVLVTDANGCTYQQQFNITAPQAMEISSSVIAASCANDDGSVDLQVSGGSAPYDIKIEDESENQALSSDMVAGLYIAHIYDANDCYQTHNFTIGLNCGDAFSIEELDIVQNDETKATMSWTVRDEPTEIFYLVERSHDLINFETIATINNRTGNAVQNEYTFVDDNIKKGIYQYQIKAIIPSLNITKTTSATIQIITNEVLQVSTYPNPAINELKVDFLLPTKAGQRLQLVNSSGNLEYDEMITEGTIVQQIHVQHLKPGIYYLNLISENNKPTSQIFIKS